MKRIIIFITISALLFASAVLGIAVYAETAYDWFFKTNTEHIQPEVFGGNKMPDKYGAIYLGSPDDKVVYLTFDAGYENGNVEKVLNVLKEHKASSAFFILPEIPRRYPHLVKRMAEEGHLVCNHSYTHRDMSAIDDYNEFLSELTRLEAVCLECTGVKMTEYFRPPKGTFSEKTLEFCQKAGYVPVFWSFAYADWDNGSQMSEDKAYEKIMSNVHNGMVLLLHPTSATNAAVLGRVLDSLTEQGYRFGTLDELNIYSRFRESSKYDDLELYREKGMVYVSNPSGPNRLALTFDDGPDPKFTDEILTVLDKYNVKATFFVVGKNADLYREPLRRVIDMGHEVGSHTYSHISLTERNLEAYMDDIRKEEELLMREFYYKPTLFRPPGGRFNSQAIEAVYKAGYKYVLYSWWIDAKDWKDVSVQSIVGDIMENVRGGDIILLHDAHSGKSSTPAALDILIPALQQQGYQFVTVSELFSS
ncbi:MAG: polysaccharide deacetylase family protein [Eubacteriales bacterium]|nr:polysaccharide deacetylase family protein [Eubacteriales bacterium]